MRFLRVKPCLVVRPLLSRPPLHRSLVMHNATSRMLIKKHLLIAMTIAPRSKVILPNGRRRVTSLAKRPRFLISKPPRDLPIAQHPVVPGRQPGQQSTARRRTSRRTRICMAKASPLFSKTIQVRSPDSGIPISAKAISPLLIRHHKQQIQL